MSDKTIREVEKMAQKNMSLLKKYMRSNPYVIILMYLPILPYLFICNPIYIFQHMCLLFFTFKYITSVFVVLLNSSLRVGLKLVSARLHHTFLYE